MKTFYVFIYICMGTGIQQAMNMKLFLLNLKIINEFEFLGQSNYTQIIHIGISTYTHI